MSKARWLGVAAVVAIAVVAVWFFAARRTSDPRTVATARSAAPVSLEPRARPERDGERSPGPELPVLIDDDPIGTLRLEGLVLDAEEHPVAGATVVVSSNPSRITTTETDGSFGFDRLVARPYTLLARAPGGVGGPLTAKLTAASDPVVLRLRPAGAVEVTVVDAKQVPVAGARVELRGLDEQTAIADGAGVARFAVVAPGGYDLVASAARYAPSFQRAQVTSSPQSITIVVNAGAAVAGTVVDDAGRAVAGARVAYEGASDWGIQADPRRDGVDTSADGRFELPGLAAGSYRFIARHADHAPGTSAIVTLDGVARKDGVEIRLPAGAVVSGRVVDARQQPVASARVRIGAAARGMLGAEPRQVYTADDGGFVVRGLARRPLRAVAMAETGSSEAVEVDASAGDVQGVVLALTLTGTIAGVVVDKAGEPLEGVQVSARPDIRGRGFDGGAMRLRGVSPELTDSGGRFEVVGLAPGEYVVRASRSATGGRRRMFGGDDGVTAMTGDRDVRVVLPADGGVTGKVAFADGSVPTPFAVGVGLTTEPFATKDGRFELRDLPPGRHRVMIRGAGFDEKTVAVDVKEGEIADVGTVVVAKGRRIAGRVTADGRPVAGATVWAGRQLVGTGSSNTSQFGGGPPGRQNTREATTDETGGFVLSGLGPSDLAVVAEHPDHGRSAAIRVTRGQPDEQSLELVLAGFGALSGKLTDGAGPAEDTIVNAQSVTSPGALYSVSSGPDGAYRFDKLAPDTYKVSAMLGMPMRGMSFYSTQATVIARREVKADLTVEKGPNSLTVTARGSNGDVRGGFAWLVAGAISARNGRELTLQMAAHPGTSKMEIFMGGRAVTYRELVPGAYTLCATALPSEVVGMQAMDYLGRHGDDLATVCVPVAIAASPTEQSAEVVVEIPPMLPD